MSPWLCVLAVFGIVSGLYNLARAVHQNDAWGLYVSGMIGVLAGTYLFAAFS